MTEEQRKDIDLINRANDVLLDYVNMKDVIHVEFSPYKINFSLKAEAIYPMLFDEDGNIIMRTDDTRYLHCISRSNKQILFNTTSSPMPIKNATFRIFPKNKYQETTAQFNLGEEVFGGDGFSLERDIRLYIDGVELKATELYDLGTFYRGSYFIKLDVNNNEDYILNNITLKVLKYSEYYGGEEEIALALHHEGSSESELVYSKQVTISEIKPSESKSIFMKLMDKPTQGLFDTGNAYRFKILIE